MRVREWVVFEGQRQVEQERCNQEMHPGDKDTRNKNMLDVAAFAADGDGEPKEHS